jgi:hypothetical protein
MLCLDSFWKVIASLRFGEIGKLSRGVAGVAWVAQDLIEKTDLPIMVHLLNQPWLHITLTSTSGEISHSSINNPKG